MLAFLPRVGYRPGSGRCPGPREEGLEAVDVDRRLQRILRGNAREKALGLGQGPALGGHGERAVTPRAQLTDVGGVEQLLGPQQHPSPTLNTVSTRPVLSFAFRSACAAAPALSPP